MKALEAIKHAQETGQIAITKQSANLLEAVEKFFDSAENLTKTIDDNLPDEMTEESNEITTRFFVLLDPVQEYVLETVGKINLKRALLYGQIDKFNGL